MNDRALQVAEWTAIAAVGASGFLNNFTPTPYEIRHEIVTPQQDLTLENLEDLRDCYRKALVGTAILGIAASLIVRSPLPAVAAGATFGVMVASYESALPAHHRLFSGQRLALVGGS